MNAKYCLLFRFLHLDGGILNLIYLKIRRKGQNVYMFSKVFLFYGRLTKRFCHHQWILAVKKVRAWGRGDGMSGVGGCWVGGWVNLLKEKKMWQKYFFQIIFLSSAVNSSFSSEICCKHKTLLSFYCFSFSRYLEFELAEHQFSSDRWFDSISRFGWIEYIHFFRSIRISVLFKLLTLLLA